MKLISAIKVKTQSLKDKRKNIRKLLDCIKGLKDADCYSSCRGVCYYNNLIGTEQAQYFNLLVNEYNSLTEQINIVGKVILFLRGNKWGF